MKSGGQNADSLRERNEQWLREHNAGAGVKGQSILIAEDSETDVFFLLRVMAQAGVLNPIHVVRNGAQTMAYLKGTGDSADREPSASAAPGIVLLDLKMPDIDGFEILRWKREQPSLQDTLMVAVSSYDGIYGINLAYEMGADTFLTKPLTIEDVLNLINAFDDYWELAHASEGERLRG